MNQVQEVRNWHLGNEIGSHHVDGLYEKRKEILNSHPELAEVLKLIADILGVAANDLCGPEDTAEFRSSDNVRVDALRLMACLESKTWPCRKLTPPAED